VTRALQAVHHRGEGHITARELRAALGYTLFGVHDCEDYHRDPDLRPPHYWDRTFDSGSVRRQGAVPTELQPPDPGLDTPPHLDRHLLAHAEQNGVTRLGEAAALLRSLRRQAYFEWSEPRIQEVAGDPRAIDLFGGRHLDDFQRVAVGSEEDRRAIC